MNISIWIGLAAMAVLVFVLALIYLMVRKNVYEQKVRIAEEKAKYLTEEAERQAEQKRKEAQIEVKDTELKMRNELEREKREQRAEILEMEKRLLQREENLDSKLKVAEEQEQKLNQKKEEIRKVTEDVLALHQKHLSELERVATITREEAKRILLEALEKDIRQETASMIKRYEEQVKKEADMKAKQIVTQAIQRLAVNTVVESSVTIVELPSDDMKGRIIGKEGRNIRAFELVTGVDLTVDDTPGAVVLSGFDPLRREVARLTLEKLIADGRIHPARVEELYAKTQEEMKGRILELGERAAQEAQVGRLSEPVINLMGRLHYRTSYGQNVLAHSVEVAHLSGMLAAELGVNVEICKRGGFLHDLGKAIDRQIDGTHQAIGAAFAQKCGESPEVVHCIAAHHEDMPLRTIEAVIVLVADAISAGRPGARRDSLERYVERLQKLEEVATSFAGVEKAYAIQAGREVRIIVNPHDVDDATATKLARDIVKKIESELDYPGQIKVTVIRETRATEYAQ